MNAQALLKTWPGFEKANAETLLGAPAWRLVTEYAGRPAMICHGAALTDSIDLAIALDDEPHRLRIGDSKAFPDLHLLWNRREALPPNLLLALVEKECGGLLQTLENAARKQLSVKGFAERTAVADTPFSLVSESSEIRFALDLSPTLAIEWGRLDNLDVAHPVIRALERPARAEYATYDLSEDERTKLAPGSVLILPEDAVPSWRMVLPGDDLVHVLSAAEASVTFGQIADDAWPELPAPDRLAVIVRGRPFATAEISVIGLAPAVKIVTLL